MQITLYTVLDAKDNDLCVFVGSIDEVAEYFNTNKATVYCNISRKNLRWRRFKIERIVELEEDDYGLN